MPEPIDDHVLVPFQAGYPGRTSFAWVGLCCSFLIVVVLYCASKVELSQVGGFFVFGFVGLLIAGGIAATIDMCTGFFADFTFYVNWQAAFTFHPQYKLSGMLSLVQVFLAIVAILDMIGLMAIIYKLGKTFLNRKNAS